MPQPVPSARQQGHNGITQGYQGSLYGGDTNKQTFGGAAQAGAPVDEGTKAALRVILPILQPKDGPQEGQTGGQETSQGSAGKQMGQQQESSIPRSPGGPGVIAAGNQANFTQLLRSFLGSRQ